MIKEDKKSIAVIGARLNSSRLPGKHLLSLAGEPLIERLCRRLSQCTRIDNIILATTADTFNQPLLDWANHTPKYLNIRCVAYEGDVNDLMGRINCIVMAENPDYLTYICGDCPLVDPLFIDHALHQLSLNEMFDKVNLKPGIKSIHEGIEIYSQHGWKSVYAASNTPETREHVGYAHKLNPCLNILEIDDNKDYSKINHRISVDTSADYEFMSRIYDLWFSQHDRNTIVDLSWVQEQLIKNPALSSINAHVVQKSPSQQYKKVNLFCHVSQSIGIGHLKRCAIIAAALQERLGLGTTIFIQGEERSLPWLNTHYQWLNDEEVLFSTIETSCEDFWILDFHPNHINMARLAECCECTKSTKNTTIIAIDKLHPLSNVVDDVFIPAFYSDLTAPNIHYGWKNYFISPSFSQIKKQKIVILTGGSDALGYGEVLPMQLEPIVPTAWTLTWIKGPYSPAPKLPNPSRWDLQENPSNLDSIIQESKIALSCYGLSLFESMASGALTFLLPSTNICDGDELHNLTDQEACVTENTLQDTLASLLSAINDFDSFRHRIKKSEQLFSKTNGAGELCEIIAKKLQKE